MATLVTVGLLYPSGGAIQGARVVARLNKFAASGQSVVLPAVVSATTDSAGECVMQLMPATGYSITISHPSVRTVVITGVTVTAVPSISLAELLASIPNGAILIDGLPLLIDGAYLIAT